MSTRSEALSPGISWNATRAASVLLVMIIAVIALLFWPSFETARPTVPAARESSTGLAAPHQPIVVDGRVCVQCLP
ncbi:MAG TPA: hypothetical protein VJ887_04570 [Actinomycetota bacterium]|nr:hypothetical protein [Actinomycetota bacterium]